MVPGSGIIFHVSGGWGYSTFHDARRQRKRFRVQCACRVQRSGFRVQGSGFKVQGLGFRVHRSGFRVQGSGFRVGKLPATAAPQPPALGTVEGSGFGFHRTVHQFSRKDRIDHI